MRPAAFTRRAQRRLQHGQGGTSIEATARVMPGGRSMDGCAECYVIRGILSESGDRCYLHDPGSSPDKKQSSATRRGWMYKEFYGFKEIPFGLTPNPK